MDDVALAAAAVLAALPTVTGLCVVAITLASRREIVREDAGYDPKFSVVCTIRGDDGVVSRVKEVLTLDGVEEFVISDDTPDDSEGVERRLGGDLRWYKRRNETDESRRHVSLNIASKHAENEDLIVMDIDTRDVTPDLARLYSGEPFAVGMVLPVPHENAFGLYEKIDNDMRQKVYQIGRHELGLCPNLSGCFYLAQRDSLRSYGYQAAYEDFMLTIDLYEAGEEVTHLGEQVATQHIPNSLGELLKRRIWWFSLFLHNVPQILKRGATMPRYRHRLGILLYPFVWYFGMYAAFASLFVGWFGGALLPGLIGTGTLLAGLWMAAVASQADETSLPRASLRATYYVSAYSVLMLLLPLMKVWKYCSDLLWASSRPDRT